MSNNIRGTGKRDTTFSQEAESNLLGLLRSMDTENQVLALNFLQGMTIPQNVLTDLLALSHFSRHHWLREQAKSLFENVAPRRFVLSLQDELNFRNFTPNRHVEWFMRVRRRQGIDSPVLARYMYHWEMLSLPAYMKYGISNSLSFFSPYIKGDSLDLSFRGMDEVPIDIQELTHIRQVDLSGNVLTRLGRIMARLPHLESLKVNGNQLRRLNPTVGRMSNLQFLDASTNLLDRLPAGLSKLQRLRYLDVSRNELEKLPNFLTEISSLEELHASRNPISHIPENLIGLRFLKKLSLDNNPNLVELPDSFGSLISLEELNLSRTGINIFPGSFSSLHRLEKLDLSFNKLRDISVIFELRNLKELDLTGTIVQHAREKLTDQEMSRLEQLTEGRQKDLQFS